MVDRPSPRPEDAHDRTGTAPLTFSERVVDAVSRSGPLCAGIDPSAALLSAWGLPDSADGVRTFGLRCVEAFAEVVPVVKPQVAFFERFGSPGVAALESVFEAAWSAGLLVIADAKRGDIASTMEAYASAWLDPASPLAVDAVTALPYLGIGSLRPLFERAAGGGRGVIVVVRGSNPEGRGIQQARMAPLDDGRSLAVEDALLEEIACLNAAGRPTSGAVGAVIGATLEPSAFCLDRLGGVVLAPGMGSQGGTPAALSALFGECPAGTVLPSASRSILDAGPDAGALRSMAQRQRDQAGAALSFPGGRL